MAPPIFAIFVRQKLPKGIFQRNFPKEFPKGISQRISRQHFGRLSLFNSAPPPSSLLPPHPPSPWPRPPLVNRVGREAPLTDLFLPFLCAKNFPKEFSKGIFQRDFPKDFSKGLAKGFLQRIVSKGFLQRSFQRVPPKDFSNFKGVSKGVSKGFFQRGFQRIIQSLARP